MAQHDKVYELAFYAQNCNTPGERCGDPTRIYGARAKETDDLEWYTGTEDEMVDQARAMAAENNRHRAKIGRGILAYFN
jgi:hypothetical protein